MAKKVGKQQVKDYVELYLWLKREMKKPEWRDFTTYIHGKAGYHDVAQTYINFLKEFESVTRGCIENWKIKGADELKDDQIAHLANALSNVNPDSSLNSINLMLGRVHGKDAGRPKALLVATMAEAKVDQLKKELEIAKRANLHHTTRDILIQLAEQYDIINQNLVAINNKVSKVGVDPTNIEEKMAKIDEQYRIIINKLDAMSAPSAGTSGSTTSKGGNAGMFVVGGLAFALFCTTIWAATYHVDIGKANENMNNANNNAIYWQEQYNNMSNSYAELNTQYQKLQDDYRALMTSPSQAALIKYIQQRQKLDVEIILALNDDRITPEERDNLVAMAQAITEIDITISLANPDLGNMIASLLTTMDKFDLAISTLNAKIIELEELIANTDDKAIIEQLTKENEQLKKDKQNIINEYNNYKASHAHSNEDVEKMKADYEAKLKEKAQESLRLQGIIDDLTAKLANAKTEKEYNELLEKYNQKVNELKIVNEDWKDLYDAFESYKINTNAVIQELRNKISTLEQTIKDKQAIIDAYEAQGPNSGITQEQYDAAVKAKKDAEEKLAKEQSAHKVTQDKLDKANKTIANLNTEINDLRTSLKTYKLTHSYSNAEYEALQDAFEDLQDRYDILREQLQNAVTQEEYDAALANLAKFQTLANRAYELFYGVSGECTPEQLAAILEQFGFDVQQNTGDPSNNIYQPGR